MKNLEIRRLIKQIESLHNESNWVGVDLFTILNEISNDVANLKLPNFNHTIHQIGCHLVATDLVVISRLRGCNYELSDEEDWIPADKIDSVWDDTINKLKRNKDELIIELQNRSDDCIDRPILEGFSSIYVTLHGYMQHSYYHFGQIVLMAKYIENLNK